MAGDPASVVVVGLRTGAFIVTLTGLDEELRKVESPPYAAVDGVIARGQIRGREGREPVPGEAARP